MKPADKEVKSGESSQVGSEAAPRPMLATVRRPSAMSWVGFNRGNAEERKKNAKTEDEQNPHDDDDRAIRFTISGDGKRMTKEDFLKEVQKLERANREVARNLVAAQEPRRTTDAPPRADKSGKTSRSDLMSSHISVTQASDDMRGDNKSPSLPAAPIRGRSSNKVTTESTPSTETPETAAERRRRLAAFATVREDDNQETPAERRRREAALGVAEDSDSDDDNTPRMTRERRGIRFAEGPAKRA